MLPEAARPINRPQGLEPFPDKVNVPAPPSRYADAVRPIPPCSMRRAGAVPRPPPGGGVLHSALGRVHDVPGKLAAVTLSYPIRFSANHSGAALPGRVRVGAGASPHPRSGEAKRTKH